MYAIWENKYNIRDTVVTSAQSRDKLGDRRSKNNKVSTTVWKEYKVERRKESKERDESSNPRREKDYKMGSR